MSVKYKVVAKANPQNREEVKYYLQPISKGIIKRDKIEEVLIRETSLSKADARGVLAILSDIIGDYVTEGYSVQLEDLGIFSQRVQSIGAETEEEVSAHNVKRVGIGFRPDSVLRDKIRKIKFEKA